MIIERKQPLLYLRAFGVHNKEKEQMLHAIAQNETRCKKLSIKESIDEFNKMIKATPYDCIQITVHDGFAREFDQTSKNVSLENKIYGLTDYDKERIKIFQQFGALEYLKRHNVKEYEKTIEWEKNLKAELLTFQGTPSIANEIAFKLLEAQKWLGAFAKWFLDYGIEIPKRDKQTKEETRETKTKQQYSIIQLATLYAEIVEKSEIESPSQQELEKNTGISQSTWSRSFRKKEFWDMVKKELNDLADTVNKRLNDTEENKNKIIQALRIAEDKADASKQRYVSNKEITSKIDNIEDSATIQPDEDLDDENINKMNKTQLINEILSLRPGIKKEELASKTEDELRSLFKLI